MPALSSRGGKRRTINEINMVPFIDVMLVLLIIFMVTAPLIAPSVVNLPSIGQSSQKPEKIIEVIIASEESLQLRIDSDEFAIRLSDLGAKIKVAQGVIDPTQARPVVISADKGVKYETVVKTMDTLQRSGITRIALAVKPQP